MTVQLSSKKSVSLYRSVNSLAVLSRYSSSKGVDINSLIYESGIRRCDLEDPDFLATVEQEFILIRNLVNLLPEQGLGINVGSQYHIGILGKVGAAAINSDTLFDAIKIILKFDELLMPYLHFDIMIKGNLVFATMKELADFKDIRLFICERHFASLYRLTSDLIGMPLKLKEMYVAYPKPVYASIYQDAFQCPVFFNAENHMIVFDKSFLYKPLPLANPLARKAYEKECMELSLRLKKQEVMSQKIIQEILFRRDDTPDFEYFARYLNTSPRTLRRRLKEEGTSYKKLVSGVRKEKAIKLLKTTSLPIQQIALETGFNDLPNFYRAFKRWTGKTPGDYRMEVS